MKKRIYTAVLFCSASVWAQQPAGVADFASSIKTKYNQNKGFIVGSAEKMPADAYGWRPTGLEAELRTFGQMLVHIANENNQQCSRASGQQGPATFDDTKSAYTKDQATKRFLRILLLFAIPFSIPSALRPCRKWLTYQDETTQHRSVRAALC